MLKTILTILLLCSVAITVGSCASRSAGDRPTPAEADNNQRDEKYDPLAMARDREIAPEAYPVDPRTAATPGDSLFEPLPLPRAGFDSTLAGADPTEVYRVQIFTSRLYNEARLEKILAEEIFNFPIYLDYEVPYYKLRVGDFLTRGEAENFIPETRAIGYRSAWVARVVLKILEPPPLDSLEQPLLPTKATDSASVLINMPGSLLTPISVDSLDSNDLE